ncbi:NHLP bacteriocin export ABC transporter permease/ATPase subunit [Streptomyces agglomeratus]|uniref:NHLP bacteriocin export ABC transporter permease/ATPase subunit n=1 Tax=Streptomyces agglomeratus TaxID=285458 RepID=A0A1E5PFX1_9ACTN|nr:NHLP bacteriocin export ABC transporter permease/ATPase subunit [Streptomyces agglomeratus]OEJ28274.1 NHLP bacteriocin export ABC transporter permease/ATPase subunit [Streptomyces agglomeratus]OEJ50200.1 NHLP bacteriocin export ABC transporter permease/ATPase subunit [Streptomyces agglomeratus]OEJ57529.1 NHLP bacteriocin export ABC transporter permease/ATPase subunit [Streptomyces agglomeratus]
MSSVHPAAVDGGGAAVPDTVTYALGGLGAPVDCAGLRSLPLEGPQVLWLVVGGALDLFAVDAAQQGHWHFLGRLEAGALLLGPVEGPQHTLLGRPSQDCLLRRIPLRELYRPAGYADPYAATDAGYESPLDHAFALGIGRGLGVLFQAPLDGRPDLEGPVGDDDVLWMPVSPGSVQYGASYSADAASDLLVETAMWQQLVNQQYRLLSAVDHWIEELERAHEDRTAAGIKAGAAVRARADQALVASIGRPDRSGRAAAGPDRATDDATFAVCRRVAEAAGITLTEPPKGGAANDRVTPVERIALGSRVRTRDVRLTGRWWRTDSGPLVGHRAKSGAPVALLWRRGGYESVNPASGMRMRIGRDNADDFEPRAVMFYRPLPERPMTPWRLLRFSLRDTRPDLRNLLLSGLVTVGLGGLVPIATGQVLGVYVPNAETGLIVQVSLAVMITSIVTASFMLLQNLTILRMEGRIEATLQPAVWDRLLRLPTKFFAARSTGELASAAMGISAIRRVLSGLGPVAVQASTVGAMNIVLLFWFSVPLALAAIAMLVVIGVVFLGMGLWQVRWQRRLVELGNKLNNQAFQTLRGLPKLRVAAAESFAYAAWAREFARSRELQQRAGRIRNLTTVLDAVYLPLCSLIMFMLLAGPARGSMSAGAFLTFSTAVTMLLTSVTQLTGALISVAAVLPMFEQIKPVLDEAPEVRGASAQPGTLSGGIEARKLTFRYTDDGPLVLDDVSLEVKPGEFVAVVGPSGCGKSTLLRLLIGFDKPLSGSVLYDGQDLAALDQAAVRRQCGVVLQNAQPLTGSILDCISGAEVFSQEEVWEAAEMAGLAEDIRRMPMGLHTMISGGGAVSGGQRQRLMIAQALVRRPRILFFDEATSALDNETQRIVMESTRRLSAGRLVIAHRLSTVMDADRVIVMADGKVVEQGPPARLLADPGGRLRELVRRQLA